MIHDVEPLFMYLSTTYVPSLEKCLENVLTIYTFSLEKCFADF